jgi:hypothetical protein
MLSFENRVYKCISSCVIFGPSLVLIRVVGTVSLYGLGQSHRFFSSAERSYCLCGRV